MDRRELRKALTEVLEKHGYYQTVEVHLMKDGQKVLKYLDEYEVRGIQVLIHDGVISHEEYYLTEEFKGETTELHFREDGLIADEFRSQFFSVASELLFEIL